MPTLTALTDKFASVLEGKKWTIAEVIAAFPELNPQAVAAVLNGLKRKGFVDTIKAKVDVWAEQTPTYRITHRGSTLKQIIRSQLSEMGIREWTEGFEDEDYDKPGEWKENSPEVKASIGMINDLKGIPKVESWRGSSTWDFGNGVHISLGNQARNVRSDILFGWSRPKSQPPFIWYVENIASNEKGQGFASQAMKKLLAMADKNGVTLRLWPHRSVSKPKDKKGTLDDKKLLQWYQRLGFMPIALSQGNSRYYERKPQ